VVEQIEEIRTELQIELFGEREPLRCSEIPVLESRAVVLIAAGSTDSSCGRSAGEVRLIKCGVDVPVVLMQSPSSDNVGTVIPLVETAEVRLTVVYRERSAGL